MTHAIKIEDFDIEESVMDEISDKLNEFCSELINNRLEEITCRGYDGFIPYSSNKGGWQSIGYTTIQDMIGSGYLSGSAKISDMVTKQYDERYEEVFKEFIEESGLDELTFFDNHEQADLFYEKLDSNFCHDYDSVQFNVQARYSGYENRMHEISLNVFISVMDAPYFRSSDDDEEVKIRFKNIHTKKFRDEFETAMVVCGQFIGNGDFY